MTCMAQVKIFTDMSSEPREIKVQTRSLKETGRTACKHLRQNNRIPGIISMGSDPPIHIKVNPAFIETIYKHSRFLGRRYKLVSAQ